MFSHQAYTRNQKTNLDAIMKAENRKKGSTSSFDFPHISSYLPEVLRSFPQKVMLS